MTDLEWVQFKTRFPRLCRDPRSASVIRSEGIVRRVPAREILYREGEKCGYLPMVLSGEVVLHKNADTGRSIVLYRIGRGESCILSTLSILNRRAFPAEAVTDVPATVVLIPAESVRMLIDTDRAWRDFAFTIYQERLSGLISLLEEIVFARLDVRLAEYLLAESRVEGGEQERGVVQRTHQEIADGLGSSREVVSRLLKEWERRGTVRLGRGQVVIEHRDELSRLSRER